MKFRVECEVESESYLEDTYEIEANGFVYTFFHDENHRFVRLAVTAPVADVERFRSEIIPDPKPGVKAHFVHRTDNELFDRLIAQLQRLESHIAFSFNLTKIDWQNPKIVTVCETPEEREIAKIFEASVRRNAQQEPVTVPRDEMAKLIVGSLKYDRLTVPMSFYREGINEYNSFRFINAFFNFYFVAEGLFGSGKTKNFQIEHEFKKSQGLRWAIEGSLEAARTSDPALYAKIETELTRSKRPLTVDGVIEHLISTRGRLHHFTHNPNRIEGTPFTHAHFEPLAYLAKAIAIFSIMHFVVVINNEAAPPN